MNSALTYRKRFILAWLLLFATACGGLPVDPTATPTSQPGFERFEGESFDIRLPASFASDAQDNLFLEEGETVTAADGFTNVSISRDKNEDYIDQTVADLAQKAIVSVEETPGLELIERFDFVPPDAEIVRLITKATPAITSLNQNIMIVQYIIKDGDMQWVISFGTRESSLDDWLERFDTSAQSFTPFD